MEKKITFSIFWHFLVFLHLPIFVNQDILNWNWHSKRIYNFRGRLRLEIEFLHRTAWTKSNYGKRHRGKRLFDEEWNSIARVLENLAREARQNWI